MLHILVFGILEHFFTLCSESIFSKVRIIYNFKDILVIDIVMLRGTFLSKAKDKHKIP